MKKIIICFCIAVLASGFIVGCGKKENPIQESTTYVPIELDEGQKNVLMETAKDDNLRAFLVALDKYNDKNGLGCMDYDCRVTDDAKNLMGFMYGETCSVDYSLYPKLTQPCINAGNLLVPKESLEWVAEKIFHIDPSVIAEYSDSCPALVDGNFVGTYAAEEGEDSWRYSEIRILSAYVQEDYYYVYYKRIHNDPNLDAETYQKDYYAVMKKETIQNEEYWTLYTQSSSGFVFMEDDPSQRLDVSYGTGKTMHINLDEGNLRVRQGPGTDYDTITALPNGREVLALGSTGEWTYIQWYEHTGWVKSEFLK